MKMNLRVLLLISCFVASSHGSLEINKAIAATLKVFLNFVKLNLERNSSVLLLPPDKPISITLPSNDLIIGNLVFTNIELFSLNAPSTWYLNTDETNEADVVLDFKVVFNKFGIRSHYSADMGLADAIPLYGDGEVSVEVSSLSLNLYLQLNLENVANPYLEDTLAINIGFRDVPSGASITGFWKQEGVSKLLSSLLSIGETFVAMWLNYENECINCELTKIVKGLINKPTDSGASVNDCASCLKDMLNGQNNLKENFEEFVGKILEGKSETAIADLLQQKEVKSYIMSSYQKLATEFEKGLNGASA